MTKWKQIKQSLIHIKYFGCLATLIETAADISTIVFCEFTVSLFIPRSIDFLLKSNFHDSCIDGTADLTTPMMIFTLSSTYRNVHTHTCKLYAQTKRYSWANLINQNPWNTNLSTAGVASHFKRNHKRLGECAGLYNTTVFQIEYKQMKTMAYEILAPLLCNKSFGMQEECKIAISPLNVYGKEKKNTFKRISSANQSDQMNESMKLAETLHFVLC